MLQPSEDIDLIIIKPTESVNPTDVIIIIYP